MLVKSFIFYHFETFLKEKKRQPYTHTLTGLVLWSHELEKPYQNVVIIFPSLLILNAAVACRSEFVSSEEEQEEPPSRSK